MDYIIAGLRVGIPERLADGMFAQALAPFAAPAAGDSRLRGNDLIIETVKEVEPAVDWQELNRFMFSDADTECVFGRDKAGYTLSMTPDDGTPRADFRIDYGSATAICNVTPQHNPSLLRFGMWQMLNIRSIQRQTLAIHSSVICYHKQAILFLGESGTGKSTHTKLWLRHILGSKLLNDDSPFVRVADGKVEAFGSPWSGKTPCYRNEHYPIRAFVRLSQAPYNRIRPLRPIEAIGALLPSCPPSFAFDERLQDAVCQTVSDIVATVPVYHLECLPDAAAAELVCNTLFAE